MHFPPKIRAPARQGHERARCVDKILSRGIIFHSFASGGNKTLFVCVRLGGMQQLMRRYIVLPAGAVVLACALGAQHRAVAAPDLARGELLFQTCAACHTVLGDGVGPDLRGVYGRKAATSPGFSYSAALKGSAIVWNDANLRAFVMDPQALVKGTAMTFPGYPAQSDVDDVIAYLETYR